MDNQTIIKQQLVKHLNGGQAFSPIDKLLNKMPFDKIGIAPDGLPYSFYQLFAHIRIAQLDILEYCTRDDYNAPNWPNDYWPDQQAMESRSEWKNLKANYFSERNAFSDLILDPSSDLTKPFRTNPEHNLLRQAELIIEHTAYHTGQLYVVYRLLNE